MSSCQHRDGSLHRPLTAEIRPRSSPIGSTPKSHSLARVPPLFSIVTFAGSLGSAKRTTSKIPARGVSIHREGDATSLTTSDLDWMNTPAGERSMLKKSRRRYHRHRQGCGWQARDRETLPSRTTEMRRASGTSPTRPTAHCRKGSDALRAFSAPSRSMCKPQRGRAAYPRFAGPILAAPGAQH